VFKKNEKYQNIKIAGTHQNENAYTLTWGEASAETCWLSWPRQDVNSERHILFTSFETRL